MASKARYVPAIMLAALVSECGAIVKAPSPKVTPTSGDKDRDIVPRFPLMTTDSALISAATPEGRGMGFFATLDMIGL